MLSPLTCTVEATFAVQTTEQNFMVATLTKRKDGSFAHDHV